MDKGGWDAAQTVGQMHQFNVAWLGLCRRLLKDDGTLWVSGTHHNLFSVGHALQSLGYRVLNTIAWHKVNPPPNLSCRYFTHATETLVWAGKSATTRHTFHYAEMKRENGGKQMTSLWHILPPRAAEKRFGRHPTQKPEALLSRVLRAASRPGDAVLDPFCGSGTTGIVCARLGRSFVGIDLSLEYLELATLRLEAERVHFTFYRWEESRISGDASRNPEPVGHPVADVARNWAERVCRALEAAGGEAHLREIEAQVGLHTPAPVLSRTWKATVRRVVREVPAIKPLGRGRYRLLETPRVGQGVMDA